ncbi:MAG: arginine--tRNA ligase [Candidatus Omnitrophota bacterium]
MEGFSQKLSKLLQKAVKEEFNIEVCPPYWELPSKQEFGDLSTAAALRLASTLKKPPMEIAERIKGFLKEESGSDISKVEVLKPGFINVFISNQTLINFLNDLLRDKDSFFRKNIKRKIIIEFCSANPTGPLSIAHGRQAVIGDTIANILDFFGNEVEREYYINDAGRQIDLLMSSVEAWLNVKDGQEPDIPEGGYKGDYIKSIAGSYLNNKKKENLKEFVLSFVLNLIKKDLSDLGVSFKNWVSQSNIINGGFVEGAIEHLNKKGLLYEEEGALWFLSTEAGDDKNRVIKKNDGELTYFASDIAYHIDKLKRGPSQLINLWGPDHHGYIGRVKAAIEALGYQRDILQIIIIQLVSLKTKERMSRRKGTALLLSDLVSDVGKDAARFYYLTRRNSSHLEFDIDLAKESSVNNPLYYIQYACARIESIFKKADILDYKPDFKSNEFIKDEEELVLLRTLMQFYYCLEKSYYSYEPVFIVDYLKSLAGSLHKFYERKKVLGEKKEVTYARLNLLCATKIVLQCALNILGITPARQM